MIDISLSQENGPHGNSISDEHGDIIYWEGAGSGLPSFQAPIGSGYTDFFTGNRYVQVGAGLNNIWNISGLSSSVSTQTADFGKSGNASSGAFLNRSGNVTSNVSGIPILLSSSRINAISTGNEDISDYTIQIYEHEGDFINAVLKYSFSVISARRGFISGLDISVNQGNQLAVKTLSSVKNLGVTVGMKGLAT